MTDPFDLERFVRAQDPVFRAVREELARGRKQSHWMWFVFPQIAGLGFSAMTNEKSRPDRRASGNTADLSSPFRFPS